MTSRAARAADPTRLPPVPADERARLLAVEAVGHATAAALDDLATLGARLGGTPMAFLNLLTEDRQLAVGAFGADHAHSSVARSHSLCSRTIAGDGPLVVQDLAADPRFADDPAVRGSGARFYAGVPVRVFDGHAVGALCLVDTVPRAMTPEEAEQALGALARQAALTLEARTATVVAHRRPT